ncbi:MAG: threonine-phosphate decarboxylase CobD [Oculatellaceae cyanobacterium Prado106]|nr:threonine-phosphate decarboxylase CobD [Oculatellaceae cyanobacterium Prado106]
MQNSTSLQPQHPRHGGNLAWAATLAGCSPQEILDFSASINPLGPPASAIAAIQANWDSLIHYPDPNYQVLRQTLGSHHDCPPDWILPGNGSAELLTWACRELAELPTTVLMTPAFGDYRRALKAFDADMTECNVMEHLFDPSWTEQIPLPQSAQPAGLLLNNPHNPTGKLFSVEAILPLLDQFSLVVVDEAFMDFLPPVQQQSLIDRIPHHPNLVVLRSLTKFYSLPGLRFGYAIAHPQRLQRWQQWRDPWSVNSLAAAAAIAVLQDIPFLQQTFDWLEAARSQLHSGLAALPGLFPLSGAANYLLVKSQHSVVQLQQQLLQQHRILIRDCLSFAELGDRYFRVAVRTLHENQRLLSGLSEILPGISPGITTEILPETPQGK